MQKSISKINGRICIKIPFLLGVLGIDLPIKHILLALKYPRSYTNTLFVYKLYSTNVLLIANTTYFLHHLQLHRIFMKCTLSTKLNLPGSINKTPGNLKKCYTILNYHYVRHKQKNLEWCTCCAYNFHRR